MVPEHANSIVPPAATADCSAFHVQSLSVVALVVDPVEAAAAATVGPPIAHNDAISAVAATRTTERSSDDRRAKAVDPTEFAPAIRKPT
jgi:hypothetical protein